MAKLTKRQQTKLNKILGKMAEVSGTDISTLQESVMPLYSPESAMYQGQSIINFFKARIQPRLEKGESGDAFDARYREWRIKDCESCSAKFAYAFAYDGVKYCSLECLDDGLRKIGLAVTRDRELTRRWGNHYHPAIVPAHAFEALQELYSERVPEAFEPDDSNLPNNHKIPSDLGSHKSIEQDSQHNTPRPIVSL